ncbi:UNVERIFIED_CONTAM: hypothetical protein PYX00_001064 [Menopon gallinae]|uniref:Ionotropic glutamate receptor C-terminal domain-containing protein n=1 Tax=Menopon gallinae TaxID=328185 RepID=A0AAW2ICR5_9NEOP
MEGRHVTVSVKKLPPYINIATENGKSTLRGYLGIIWTMLESRLHFSSQLFTDDFVKGLPHLRNYDRDVILYPGTVTPKNFEHYDLSVPLLSSWYSLYIKDSDEANSSESFVKNLSASLWVSTVLMISIFTIFLYLMLNISLRFLSAKTIEIPRMRRRGKQKLLNPSSANEVNTEFDKLRILNDASLGNCFIITLAAFCSQGYILSTRMFSIRLVLLNILFFGMIMCNSYSALLMSQLTLREPLLPFKTLEEIPTQATDYSLCVRENSLPYMSFMVNETSKALRKEWANIINRKPCVRGIIPADVMCAPRIAFLETPAIIQNSIHRNFKCKITNLKQKYFKVHFTILLYRTIDYKAKREIDNEIIRYRELGILRRLITTHVRQDELFSPAEESELQVTFEHIYGVLLVYFFCVGVSFVLLLLEIVIDRLTRRCRSQTHPKDLRYGFQSNRNRLLFQTHSTLKRL